VLGAHGAGVLQAADLERDEQSPVHR